MRRPISAAVLGCALLVTSSCSASAETPSAHPSGQSTAASPASAASPTPAVTLVDKAATCAALDKTLVQVGDKAVEIGRRLLSASEGSAEHKAAVVDVQKLWATAQAELEQQAAAAKDPEVKTVIANYAAEVKKAVAVAVAGGTDADKTREAFSGAALVDAQRKAIELCE